MRFLPGSVVLASLALVACGPSLKAAVESDMRFEHCYRIDEDASTPVAHKRGCWKEWTARYSRGQARERISYAKERVRVLHGAVDAAPPPMVASTQTAAAGPPPGDPYAPPPKVVPKAVEAVTASNQACSDACSKAWNTCAKPCTAEATCILACDEKFRLCAKACL